MDLEGEGFEKLLRVFHNIFIAGMGAVPLQQGKFGAMGDGSGLIPKRGGHLENPLQAAYE